MEIRKLRLMTVVGTRPEIIKMSEIIKKALKSSLATASSASSPLWCP